MCTVPTPASSTKTLSTPAFPLAPPKHALAGFRPPRLPSLLRAADECVIWTGSEMPTQEAPGLALERLLRVASTVAASMKAPATSPGKG